MYLHTSKYLGGRIEVFFPHNALSSISGSLTVVASYIFVLLLINVPFKWRGERAGGLIGTEFMFKIGASYGRIYKGF